MGPCACACVCIGVSMYQGVRACRGESVAYAACGFHAHTHVLMYNIEERLRKLGTCAIAHVMTTTFFFPK